MSNLYGTSRSRETGSGRLQSSDLTPPIKNKTLDATYYAQRAAEAEAKREASKAKEAQREKLLRDLAFDRKTMTSHELRVKYKVGHSKLLDLLADVDLFRY